MATLTACVAIGAASLTATGNIGASDSVFIGKDSGGGSWSTAGCDNNTAVGAGTMAGAMNGATRGKQEPRPRRCRWVQDGDWG